MQNIYRTTIIMFGFLFLTACAKSGSSNAGADSQAPQISGDYSSYAKLPWESAGKSRLWSEYLYEQIENSSATYFKGASDVESFCSNYYSLNSKEQTEFWANLMVQMIKHESSYNPLLRFKEPGGSIDPITKQSVYSEGLFQLSYQDTQWMPQCEFSWTQDKIFAMANPQRTILNPYKNMHCGVLILKRQLSKYNKIAIASGAYWAVIKTDSSYNKLATIKAATQKLAICQN